ncbi:MAG: hypothetical protein WAW53_13045 [Candidatus Dormiibacterota bacterium]
MVYSSVPGNQLVHVDHAHPAPLLNGKVTTVSQRRISGFGTVGGDQDDPEHVSALP